MRPLAILTIMSLEPEAVSERLPKISTSDFQVAIHGTVNGNIAQVCITQLKKMHFQVLRLTKENKDMKTLVQDLKLTQQYH